MSAANVASALGGRPNGAGWIARCPTHMDGTPSLSLRDGGDGLLVHCFAGCDPRDVLAELRRRGLTDGDVKPRAPRDDGDEKQRRANALIGRRLSDRKRIAEVVALWGATEPPGTVIAAYLVNRGITLPVPEVLRWAPDACAMVARIDDLHGRLTGVHRTFFYVSGRGWRRRNRRMLGRAKGGAVRLAPAAERLMVGEGIETVMSAMQATGLPGWAALSTSGMTALTLPGIVRDVIILADNDLSGAGERAARAAASRWVREGRTVRIAMPPEPGTDFNDILRARGGLQDAR
jgi:hypothetical protein